MARNFFLLSVIFSLASCLVHAHSHHDQLTDEEKSAPVDAILWIHIVLQALVWGLLFPAGMVLGITRSRWHVPLQSTGFALTLAGYVLGHKHKGRMFLKSVHGTYANILFIPIFAQLALGIYLKLHIHEKSIRPYMVRLHGVIGKAYPIFGWVQMVFGCATFRGYCRGGHLGQCLAHYIMGGGFIAYGIIMALLLLVGEAWVRRSGRSPEWWDSWVIMLWVSILNTFTEHHGGDWSAKDMQHTILGVLWWCGGALGIFLARNNQRNVVPGLIIILTGWGMSEHAQALMISTKVHTMFGYTLMLAGFTRIIEICFFSNHTNSEAPEEDDNNSEHTIAAQSPRFSTGSVSLSESSQTSAAKVFRHLPPFRCFLTVTRLLFMSATDEEVQFVHDSEMDHVTYILIMFSLSFLLYTLIVWMIHLYTISGRNAPDAKNDSSDSMEMASGMRTKWYSRVPSAEASNHIIGDEEDD
ncbi:uncharacterized protein BT62DRAFT_898562 [Guyanagaster necrorhizus]|uniref:Protein YTP1 n=1 Tax=Guyanagaster necrorhizus TaxID=856835 RepID=A0A9P8ARJ4_9AGAR|nr:uncharacterized protein BT62DRAFT_898562 [Guyanagaster necrorhizus MCA 3950]KAG7445160.1 hypothetical protein BT62DRAFT_898562 [Guyanagaster necrorhizus MCA 3950]